VRFEDRVRRLENSAFEIFAKSLLDLNRIRNGPADSLDSFVHSDSSPARFYGCLPSQP
jgi:hypothetical protein